MAGDEIVAEWLGDVYSNGFLANQTVQRFSATSLRFKTVTIYTGASWVHVGKYNSNVTTFITHALYLYENKTIALEYVDLYDLGVRVSSGTADMRVLGINEY